jgi:hypothetical protein
MLKQSWIDCGGFQASGKGCRRNAAIAGEKGIPARICTKGQTNVRNGTLPQTTL